MRREERHMKEEGVFGSVGCEIDRLRRGKSQESMYRDDETRLWKYSKKGTGDQRPSNG